MAGIVDDWVGGRAAGGGRRAAHAWCALLASTGARIQQYILSFWPCDRNVKHQNIMHLAFLIKFMSLTYIAISVSLGSLYKSHVAANCGVKVCSTFVTVTEPACMQCCMRSLSAACLCAGTRDAYARSMAACLRGSGPATTCAASWLQLQRPSTRGLMVYGLLRLHLGRSQPSVRTWWLWPVA